MAHCPLQEGASVLAAAAVQEVVHHRLEVFEDTRAVRPQVGLVRLLLVRREHRHRRLVGVQHAVAQDLLLERVDQQMQMHAA